MQEELTIAKAFLEKLPKRKVLLEIERQIWRTSRDGGINSAWLEA